MEPDKAHRTLNTGLLVIIMAMVSVQTHSLGTGLAASFFEVVIWGSIVLAMFIGLRLAERHIDEIREYLELA